MAYKRSGRPTWYFNARTRMGWQTLSSGTPTKKLAEKMEGMWDTLAKGERAWDVLDPVLGGVRTVGSLYDKWKESKENIVELRRLLNDVDLEPLVADFLAVHRHKVEEDTADHIAQHLRWLIPADVTHDDGSITHLPFPRSTVTEEFLTAKLYSYKGKPGTIRKVHSDWSVFFAYCHKPLRLFPANIMDAVERPPAKKAIPQFYELDIVEQIVEWQPTTERACLMAFYYGGAIEVSVAKDLIKADILDAKNRLVRAAGTKTHTRDRVSHINEWAWPYIEAHARTIIGSQTRLFPASWSRHTISDWHRQTITRGLKDTTGKVIKPGLGLTKKLPLKNSRHHWAVYMLRAGAPVKLVQEQLGHASAQLTLNVYGQFRPSGHDQLGWSKKAAAYEAARRAAEEALNAPMQAAEGH